MDDLTGFQRDLLRTIAVLGDPKGLAIKDYIDENAGVEISHGRLYTNLDRLVNMGLVTKSKRDNRTNEYSLTRRGERDVRHQFERWSDAVEA